MASGPGRVRAAVALLLLLTGPALAPARVREGSHKLTPAAAPAHAKGALLSRAGKLVPAARIARRLYVTAAQQRPPRSVGVPQDGEQELREWGHIAVGDVGLHLTVRKTRPNGRASLCQVVVSKVMQGGPAHGSGIRKGDVVLSIDGVHVKPGCADVFESLCEGPSGSAVNITLQAGQDKEPMTVNLVRRAGYRASVDALPHDLYAPGPCFACLPNPAPRLIGNVSIAFLWPTYLAHLRHMRAQHPDTANTDENAAACRNAKIGYLRLVLDLKKYFDSGSLVGRLNALPPTIHRRLNLPPLPPGAEKEAPHIYFLKAADEVEAGDEQAMPGARTAVSDSTRRGKQPTAVHAAGGVSANHAQVVPSHTPKRLLCVTRVDRRRASCM